MVMTFAGEIIRWIDGDTVDIRLDLGFNIFYTQRFRLARIDTPERGKPLYADAIAFANLAAPVGSKATVVCYGHDKYQRWIADIKNVEGECVNDLLLEQKFAVPYVGAT